jgi:TonB family protein
MRSCLPIVMSLSICACANMGPVTPPLPITPHAVSEADYPQDSVKSQEKGATTLRYVILEDGTTGDIQILKSSGFTLLDQASIAMVKSKWRFKPATANGKAVRFAQDVKIEFRLSPTPASYLLVYAAQECREPEVELSPGARMLIAPIYAVYQGIELRQSALPPSKDDAERLVRMGELDQAVRSGTLEKINLSSLPPEQRDAAFKAEWNEINRHDLVNQLALKAMLPREGWFLKSRYGQNVVQTAFDIIYHAVNDKELQHAILAAIEPLVAKGEIRAQAYGMLYDRVAIGDNRPQRYGSAFVCKDRKRVLAPLEDPEQVDVWRKTMGFPLTVEENAAYFANGPPCG